MMGINDAFYEAHFVKEDSFVPGQSIASTLTGRTLNIQPKPTSYMLNIEVFIYNTVQKI